MKASILLTIGALATTFASGLETRQGNWTVGQTVQTQSGPVSGHPATNQSSVSEYLGIPYAQPPIGDLRFAAPATFTSSTPLNGTTFGFTCPVRSSNSSSATLAGYEAANITATGVEIFSILGTVGPYNEDCLYLNVWAKPQTGESKKAVLVWIYGGGFQGGGSSTKGYNGANLAELEDVVVVSFNYRVSILGFPGAPNTTQNLGLLDQRAAVAWVRDNIENFGGDASRITLFGQSAGGASVDFYSYAWASDPIAAGFVSGSGTAFSWGLPLATATQVDSWFTVTNTLGCGNSTSDADQVMSCMRTKDYQDVLDAIPASTDLITLILGYFGPTVDEKVIFSNYSARTPSAIPLLIGNNHYEVGLFRTELAIAGFTFPDRLWDAIDLQEFTCPAGIRANASLATKNPTWRYRYFGVFPDTEISSEGGAYHGAELPMIFDVLPDSPVATAEEISIASYIRGAWATFAKDPEKGLSTYEGGWPTYNAGEETLIRLAYNNTTGTNLALPSLYDALCVYVNVSSTNESAYLTIPTAVPSPVSTTTSTGSDVGTAMGSAPASTTTKNSEGFRMVQLSTAVLLGGVFGALVLV